MAPEFSKPVTFFHAGSPNGFDCHILLEELKVSYGGEPDYEAFRLSYAPPEEGSDINTSPSFNSPWYSKISPNATVPALLHNDFPVFETSAILLYLSATFDTKHVFGFDQGREPREYSEMVQWLLFAHGSLCPTMMSTHRLMRDMEKRPSPLALETTLTTLTRLLTVLDARLTNRSYLAGPGEGKYTIADIKTAPWIIKGAEYKVIDLSTFPGIKAWAERVSAREAVKGVMSPAGAQA